jgi:hypothetical protein
MTVVLSQPLQRAYEFAQFCKHGRFPIGLMAEIIQLTKDLRLNSRSTEKTRIINQLIHDHFNALGCTDIDLNNHGQVTFVDHDGRHWTLPEV